MNTAPPDKPALIASLLNDAMDRLDAVTKERDALAADAKLALGALDHHPFNYKMNPAECDAQQQAIDALRKAGVK